MKARPMYVVAVTTFIAAVVTTLCSKTVNTIMLVLLSITAVMLGHLTYTGRWRR